MANDPVAAIAKWQRMLDRDFPQGALCQWVRPGRVLVSYQIPRIEVTSMAGLDPVVRLAAAGSEKVLSGLRMLSYAITQREPCLEAKVAIDGEDPMLWSAGVGPGLAAAMAPLRQERIAAAPDGGDD